MDYTFKVDKLIPKAEFMSVTYMADGYPDYRRNFNPTDFSKESLTKMVEDFAPIVVDFWVRQASHPELVSFAGGSGSAEAPVTQDIDPSHVPVIEPEPEYDQFTQYITLNMIEDPMQETVGWTVTDMTAEEQAQYLEDWRENVIVNMVQFRLALSEKQILKQVSESVVNRKGDGDPTTEIMWTADALVARNSEWAKAELGLDDAGMDEFFKLALTMPIAL